MKVADVWMEAAEMAELWAALGRAATRAGKDGRRRMSAIEVEITEETARHLVLLGKAFRTRAAQETRAIDFDDQPTPVRGLGEILDGMMFVDDDPTDPAG